MSNDSNVDDRFLTAMQNGDQSALGFIIQKYTAYVGTIVWNIVQGKLSRSDAEEIASDVFYTLWRHAGKIRLGKLKGYLAVISRRRALDALRSAKIELELEDDVIQVSTVGLDEEVIRQDTYTALRQTVCSLPEPDRTIFIQHYYFYRKTAEIADALGINVNTVQSKLRRGRERLRRELTEGGCFIG